jgi:octaprenyl-diphosphate synthase
MILEQTLVPHDIPDHLVKLKAMYEDLFSGGKGYRGALVQSVSSELGLTVDQSHLLSACIEYIHNSSLLHDDFVDNSELRRGKTTAWKKYGGGYAILGGDYLLAKVIKNLCSQNSIELIDYTSATILALVEGEWLQDDCHGRADVSIKEIERVHELKTSALFSWCFKAPAYLSEQKSDEKALKDLEQLGLLLGSLLQRSDDLLDYNIRNFENKTYFRDLPSGYFNLFTIHLLKDVELHKRQKAFEMKSLDQFLNEFNLDLEKTLTKFDEESTKIIIKAENCINDLKMFSRDFKNDLIEATHQIYWRKKD